MAARKNKINHTDDVRARIQGSQLVNFVQDHVLKGKPAQKTQITAALGLLKKVIPDLQTIDGNLNHTVKHENALDELE